MGNKQRLFFVCKCVSFHFGCMGALFVNHNSNKKCSNSIEIHNWNIVIDCIRNKDISSVFSPTVIYFKFEEFNSIIHIIMVSFSVLDLFLYCPKSNVVWLTICLEKKKKKKKCCFVAKNVLRCRQNNNIYCLGFWFSFWFSWTSAFGDDAEDVHFPKFKFNLFRSKF